MEYLNPKALSPKELYGYITAATREWRDGMLSDQLRSLGLIPNEDPKWIALDGDLDTIWIESMNSVMVKEIKSEGASIAKERASRNGSTVVDVSMTLPSFNPVSVSLSRFSQSKTPKQVFFNPMNIFDTFTTLFLLLLL